MAFRAVLFDLGGVVLGSPFEGIARYEKSLGIEPGFISRHIVATGDTGAFAKLERGELDMEAFGEHFAEECLAKGVNASGVGLIDAIRRATAPRPAFLTAIRVLRERGLVAAALTNNWKNDGTALVASLFDVFLESSKLGLRKPDPRIYEVACERIGAAPTEIAYLDDLGVNLKPARALGMTTILVRAPDAALAELEERLGFALA